MAPRDNRTDLTADELRRLFDYNPETGQFISRVARPRNPIGTIAGTVQQSGYVSIMVWGKHYYGHRLAWLYCHGRWPKNLVDHVNHNRADNRLCNLREASVSENKANRPRAYRNQYGLPGVLKAPGNNPKKPWCSAIALSGKRTWLGSFYTKEEAHQAYMTAGRQHYGEFFGIAAGVS